MSCWGVCWGDPEMAKLLRPFLSSGLWLHDPRHVACELCGIGDTVHTTGSTCSRTTRKIGLSRAKDRPQAPCAKRSVEIVPGDAQDAWNKGGNSSHSRPPPSAQPKLCDPNIPQNVKIATARDICWDPASVCSGGGGGSPHMLLLSWQWAASIHFSPLTKIHKAAVLAPPVSVCPSEEGRGINPLPIHTAILFSAECTHSAMAECPTALHERK